MSLLQVAIFVSFALVVSLIQNHKVRGWILLAASILTIYWLQSASPIRQLDFWLPTISITLSGIVYFATRSSPSDEQKRSDRNAAGTMIAVVAAVAALRYLNPICCITPTTPPHFQIVLLGLSFVAGLWLLSAQLFSRSINWLNSLLILLLVFFLIQKNATLSVFASERLRLFTGQSPELAGALDIIWVGYSYIAFRLIHVLRDRITGRLPEVNLREMMTYIIFFPTFTAGPIDRIQRFIEDLREEYSLNSSTLLMGGQRIVMGLFKKFVIADSLALIAVSSTNTVEVKSSAWMWVMLYAYSFRIYFDFSGYTDIAIGIGNLLGFSLPENFNRSYLQSNLTTFWNNWHMTLTHWFRAYFFNPFTRKLRSSQFKLPMWVIILLGQLATMVLIGLWHGVTRNFVVWGIWHGIGLFIHNRWGAFINARVDFQGMSPRNQKIINALNIFLTFNYVSLGWLWFVLPSPDTSIRVFEILFGM